MMSKESNMMDDFPNELSQFTGTEQYYSNPLYRWLKYTDGVKFFCQNAGGGAYWFLDIVGTELRSLAHHNTFLVIDLVVDAKEKCEIRVTNGDDEKLWSKKIGYTDCPAGSYKFFLYSDVMMLASEY